MLTGIACGSDDAASPTPASTTVTAPTVTPTPTPTATLTPGQALTAPQLKYLLIAHYGGIFYCDPHEYPIGRPEQELIDAIEQFPAVQADTDEYEAILDFLETAGTPEITDEFRLKVFREHKKLNALTLTAGDDDFDYSVRIGEETGSGEGFLVEGTVSPAGDVTETGREQSFNTCPICLADSVLIDTPDGPVPVTQIETGMLVWTMDASGRRVAAEVTRADSVEAPSWHKVVRLALDDGRTLTASPGHPLADGRLLGDITRGDTVDGATALSADLIAYTGRTYDLLPAGDTGVYWANGVPAGSTLISR
jgi:hypothetical protein